VKDIKEQFEETVTKKLDEAEKHHDIVHKMMIKNHALEKRLDEAGESHKKMNATVEHTQ
jgi:butyrate kinase